MFSKILVPLDGSKLAELALPYAEELARALNSEIDLIEVCEKKDCPERHIHQLYVKKMAKLLRNRLNAVGPAATVKPIVRDGKSAAEIIDYTEKSRISLIIMATHGRSGIMLWAMGSVANKILHHIHIPILLIRVKAGTIKGGKGEMFSKIMVPLDGSDSGETVLPHVMELATGVRSEVTLFQVIAPGVHVHTIGGLDYIRFPEQQIASKKASAKQYLEEVSKKFKGMKTTVRSELKFGDPAAEIIKFAGETDIHLVAMSAHGHSGIGRWTFGSVTHKVLHNGSTHVLLVRVPDVKA